MKRLFVAIEIKPDQGFLGHYYGLKKSLEHENIKWVEPDKLHLTLKFFGETMETQIPAIGDLLEVIGHQTRAFSVHLKGAGIFGSAYHPRVIWLGVQQPEPLSALAKRVLSEVESLGYLRDRQNYVPHLTLGRIRAINDKNRFQRTIDAYKDISFLDMEVGKLILFESILQAKGAKYEVISEFHLKG